MRRFLRLVPIAAAALTAAMGPTVYAAGGNVIYDGTAVRFTASNAGGQG